MEVFNPSGFEIAKVMLTICPNLHRHLQRSVLEQTLYRFTTNSSCCRKEFLVILTTHKFTNNYCMSSIKEQHCSNLMRKGISEFGCRYY
ncbi:uncharacterized protein [Rutidosis leptorrhynchoides]|uniref:uncharacterized protein isoform X3 n=1 Tax=Rutidosis leptorrhynchoides TaxID=125765 RepID=UPI003A9A3CE2